MTTSIQAQGFVAYPDPMWIAAYPYVSLPEYPNERNTYGVWAGPEAVFTESFTFNKKDSGLRHFRLLDMEKGVERIDRKLQDEQPPFSGTQYIHTVIWNGMTCRLGHEQRKENGEYKLDVVIWAMSEKDLSDVLPKTVLLTLDIESAVWMIPELLKYDMSPDGSKLMVYVNGVSTKDGKMQWPCAVIQRDGSHWNKLHVLDQKFDKEFTMDMAVTNNGEVYVLTHDHLYQITKGALEQHAIPIPSEAKLMNGILYPDGGNIRIFGFMGEKTFENGKFISFDLDTSSKTFSSPGISNFPEQKGFEPQEIQMAKASEGYWLTATDRKFNASNTITKHLFICRINDAGSLEWALYIPKPMTTQHWDQPEVILYPKDDQLIVMFQESEKNMEARSKGSAPRFGITQVRHLSQEYDVVKLTVASDQQTSIEWVESDGARCRWGYVQQVNDRTFFNGNAHTAKQMGFMYWTF